MAEELNTGVKTQKPRQTPDGLSKDIAQRKLDQYKNILNTLRRDQER